MNKTKKICTTVLAAALLFATFGGLAAGAGQCADVSAGQISSTVLDSSFLSGSEISTTYWRTEGDVSLSDGKAYLTAEGEASAILMYRDALNLEGGQDGYVINARIGYSQLSGDTRFGIGFGFDRVRYAVGDENTNFVYVTQNNGTTVAGVCSYDENGAVTELTEQKTLSGSEFTVQITADTDGVTVLLDGAQLYSGTTTSDGLGGYFCFTAAGGSASSSATVYLSSFSATNDYNDTPENVNINDDFEDESLDTSIWYLYNDAPYLKGVAETDGMLRFIDSNGSTVSTRYKYSNFAMSFDIPYIKRTAEYLDNGTLQSPVCSRIDVFCGIDIDDYNAITTVDSLISTYSSYFLSFTCDVTSGVSSGTTTAMFGLSSSRTSYTLPDEYNLWDPDFDGRNVNVSFTFIDGVFNLDIKWEDETEWYHVFTVTRYDMVSGYITFGGYGTGATYSAYKANFALDNVKITNRDYDGNVLSGITATSSNLPDGDYGYADSKSTYDLLVDGTDFDAETSSNLTGLWVAAGVLAAGCIAAGVVLIAGGKKKNKGGE